MKETTISREGSVTAGHTSRRILAIAVLIGGASLAACEEDPVGSGSHEEAVAGFELRTLAGTTLMRYTAGMASNPPVLNLTAGAEQSVQVVWLDGDGDIVQVDADEHAWLLTLAHPGIIDFEHDASSDWRGTFDVAGLASGTSAETAMKVYLYHGDVGDEEEWASPFITVRAAS